MTVGYLGVRGVHLSRTRDINFLPAVPQQGTFADGTPVTYLRHPGRANPAFGRISLFDSGADSIYHGGFVQLSKRFSQHFQVQTSYTFSKVIDSRPDFTSVVVGTDDSKNAQDTLAPNLERGRGNADITHRFIFSGIWDIDYAKSLQNPIARNLLRGYQFSLIGTVQSGRPITATVGGDPNGDTNTATDRPPYVGRNTYTGPNFATADIRFTRDIPLYGDRVSLRLISKRSTLRTAPTSITSTRRSTTSPRRHASSRPTQRSSRPRPLSIRGSCNWRRRSDFRSWRRFYNAYRPASMTCRAICRPSAIVSDGLVLREAAQHAPSASAACRLPPPPAITLRVASSTTWNAARRVVPRHRDGLLRRRFAAIRRQLLRAEDARFDRVHLGDAVGQRAHDLLLVGERLHVFLRCRAGGEQRQLPGVGEQLMLGRERPFAVFAAMTAPPSPRP